jgi:Tubulin domain
VVGNTFLVGKEIDRTTRQGRTSTQKQAVIEPNEYQKNLDQGLPTFQLRAEQVRYWSDFNRVYYHPRSIVQLNEYELHSQLMPFENWDAGRDLFNDLDRDFDLLDRDVRPFAEECDQLAGIQIFTTADDAWGGFSSSYTDVLRDEYGKTSLWVWDIEDGLRGSRVSCASKSCKVYRSYQAADKDAPQRECC